MRESLPIGPTVSRRSGEIRNIFSSGTSPKVGLQFHIPEQAAGVRIDPAVGPQGDIGQPGRDPAAEPLDDPPGI